jgi:outer membrane protein assembly factor BamB
MYSSPIAAEGKIYACGGQKELYALDATTGASNWVFQTEGRIASSPCVVTESGKVYHSGISGAQE